MNKPMITTKVVKILVRIMEDDGELRILKYKALNEMMKEARKGNINLYLGIVYSDERSKFVKFGTILDYVFKCAIFRKDREPISSFKDLRNKRVVEVSSVISFSKSDLPIRNG